MKEYRTIYFRHCGYMTDKDVNGLDYALNEMAKMGYHLVDTLDHVPFRDEGIYEVILLFFERDIPDEE